MGTAGGKVKHRGAITVCIMLATLMQALDTTIANVALPYMQGSLSASQDQINWVLTSYIVAAAIMTPPTGWLAARFGRTRLFLWCVAGFTTASALCGLSTTLGEIVLARLLQGAFGAALVPLSQAVMLDIYPKEQQGAAMGVWGVGVMVGPIIGPTVGGWLTENYNWGSVFYINLPIGILAWLGLRAFLGETRRDSASSFDWFGFGTLSLGLGAIQLMLDRGEQLDWFGSTEIIAETCVGALGFYFFAVHMFTAKAPFISPRLFRDWNFTAGSLCMLALATIMLSTMALITPFLQSLMAYPVMTAGMVMSPRGAGTMLAMMVAGRMTGKVDARIPIIIGLGLTAHALYRMTGFTADVSIATIVSTGIEQGFGLGMVFVPMSAVTFATLPPTLRTEGAGVFALMRNIGGAVGISIAMTFLQDRMRENHAEIVNYVKPFNALFQPGALAGALAPTSPRAAALLDAQIQHQAAVIAYIDDYKLMMLVALCAMPLALAMRPSRRAPAGGEKSMVLD